MVLSKTLSIIHKDDYSDFTPEKYQHLVLCKVDKKEGPTFSLFCHGCHSHINLAFTCQICHKKVTPTQFYFSFNNLLLYNPENYNIYYHIAPSAVGIFWKAGA